MTVEALRHALHARPFTPFTLRIADGREYEVEHPEFLAFSTGGRTISVSTPDDGFDIIDLLRVTSIHHSNGHSKRKSGRKKK